MRQAEGFGETLRGVEPADGKGNAERIYVGRGNAGRVESIEKNNPGTRPLLELEGE